MINFTVGDATRPRGDEPKIIAHVCNDVGGWGAGFVLALSARWPEPEVAYVNWHRGRVDFFLGATQVVQVEPDVWVANMIGQHDVVADADGRPPIRYDALEQALATLAVAAIQLEASVHMPRIGCGLAGGEWFEVEQIINSTLVASGLDVTVYDFG